MPDRRRNRGPQIDRLAGVRIIEAEHPDVEAFRRAQVQSADAVALVRQDDVGNIHAALQAQELNPRVHLVIRMFNLSLGLGVRNLFQDCSVISDAAMAAPAFVAAALKEAAPVHARVPGRTLYVAGREEAASGTVVCSLARTVGGRTIVFPGDQAPDDLVLAVVEGEPGRPIDDPAGPSRRVSRFRRWLLHQRANPLRVLRLLLDRKLTLAAVILVALLLGGTGVLAAVDDLSWENAAYVTLLTALGGAEPDVEQQAAAKILQAVLTVFSIALIPVLTGAVVEAVVNARLAIALGRLREPMAGHIVVVGLGNVGTRVIRDLHLRGLPVVAIDRVDTARGAQLARHLGIPLVIGDASREETLRSASVHTCRALVVLSTDDVVNLETAINGRQLNPQVRLVMRLFDGDFADRVERAFRIDVSRSVSYLTAPVFAASMLRREVIGAIPVNRRIMLIAEVPIGVGASGDGATIDAVHTLDGVRVIAVRSGGRQLWSPPGAQRLAAGDQLVVVATRDGLGRVVAFSD